MPYSELHRLTRERLESTQMKLTSSLDNPASVPDDEFVELVWENGQLLMQGQSNKTRKNSPGFTSHQYKAQGHEEGDAVLPKFERIVNENAVLNDFSSSGQMGLGQDDELVRWLNYPLDDYCAEFFSEFSGVNQSTLAAQNSATHIHKSNSSALIDRDSRRGSTYVGDSSEQGNASKVVGEGSDLTTRARDSKLFSPTLQQCETSIPSHRSRVSEFSARSAYPSQRGDSNQNLTLSSGMPNNKIQKQRSETARLQHHPSSLTGFTNFSHFLRPATLVKSNQQNISAIGSQELLHMERTQSNNKASVASSSNLNESTVVESNSVSRSIPSFQSRPISLPGKAGVKSFMHKPPKESLFNERSEAICGEDASWKSRSSDQALGGSSSFGASTAIGRSDSEKGVEPVVGSSSVCSGNSTGGASNDLKSSLKRKVRDNEESEYPSEDVEEESVGVRKAAPGRGGTGSKRSRAAEVHNLSERRRRDRINEKMKALQELIPNCNKVDKASMLDEAIEYLKTLQLQVQIMSMGTGLYVHPMMFPTGMQQMHASNMTPFSPMSVGMGMGMGMGMGFGMGMLNASGGSSGCPLIQVPPMHGAHFPDPPISGPSNTPTITASNHPMFGLPAPGHPMSMPRPPFIPHSGGSSANSAVTIPAVPGIATLLAVPNSINHSCSKDPIENMTIPMLKTDIECSHSQIPIQARDGIEQPALLQRNDRVSTSACERRK